MHLAIRIALCLMVGLPALGRAQTVDAPVASPDASPPPLVTAPPPVSPAPYESAPPHPRGEIIPRPYKSDSSTLLIPRILLGTTVGSLTGAGGEVVGFIGGLLLANCSLFEGCDGGSDFLIVAPTVLMTGLGSSLTVYGLGRALDGEGTFAGAMIGGLIGAGAGVALAFGGSGTAGVLLMPVLSAGAAVIAYEISSAGEPPASARARDDGSDLQLIPTFGMTPRGGVLGGLFGTF